MKLKLIQIKTKALLKRNRQIRTNPPYKHARTIGIIFTVEDKQKHFYVKEFVRRLENDGKHIQVLEYLPEKRDNYEFKFEFFTEKDFSFWGHLYSPNAIQFADAPFDFLFCLDAEPNPFVLHILARSRAKCRIGRHWEKHEQYLDFMIASAGNVQALGDGFYRYVTMLK